MRWPGRPANCPTIRRIAWFPAPTPQRECALQVRTVDQATSSRRASVGSGTIRAISAPNLGWGRRSEELLFLTAASSLKHYHRPTNCWLVGPCILLGT